MSFVKNGVSIQPYRLRGDDRRRFDVTFPNGSGVILTEEDFRVLQEFDLDGFNHESTGWVQR